MERLMLKLKLQYFGYLMQRANTLGKILMLEKIEGRRSGQQRMRWLDGIIDSISSVQFSHSVVSDSATLWTTAYQASLSITNSQSLPKLMSIESVMPSNHLILCYPLILPSIFPYFLQFKNEFGNKEFMIWAAVSSWSCLCWLYRASLSLAAKNIINLISVLSIWWCPCVELSLELLEEGVCYDQCVRLAKLY